MSEDVEVRVLRGGIIESRHRVRWVVSDRSGAISAGEGGGDVTTFRSSAKPFQLVPLVERGHADRLGFGAEQLAVMAASHTGSAYHRDLVRGILDRLGASASDLACGYHDPADPEALREIRRSPELASRLYNNCSGKHAGMLALAREEGWPLEGYQLESHPLQQLMRQTVAECCGVAPESLGVAIDGCSVCVFSLPLQAMARGYARLAVAVEGASEPRERALQAIGRAMAAHPVAVEGHDQLATELMRTTSGRLLAKGGAEGLLLVGDRSRGLGLALKCVDGAGRAVAPAAITVLDRLGWLRTEEREGLRPRSRPAVTNAAGESVGHLEAAPATAALV